MDQIKIGRFIAACRKNQGIAQMQLAEKLGITDRAVSKWENGKSLPDASIMLDLCGLLGITVNDLLCGEVVSMENYNKELEKNLLEMVRQKEETDRQMLRLEIVIGVLSVIVLLTFVFMAALAPMTEWMRLVLVAAGFIPCMIGLAYSLRIEQVAGYYECARCHHRYVPDYKSVFWAMHMGRTRYLRCPECHQHSWSKKVISKE